MLNIDVEWKMSRCNFGIADPLAFSYCKLAQKHCGYKGWKSVEHQPSMKRSGYTTAI